MRLKEILLYSISKKYNLVNELKQINNLSAIIQYPLDKADSEIEVRINRK
jgi:hypothetical protein